MKKTVNFPGGAKYVGQWVDISPHGHGTFTLANAKKKIGKFYNGEFLG